MNYQQQVHQQVARERFENYQREAEQARILRAAYPRPDWALKVRQYAAQQLRRVANALASDEAIGADEMSKA